MSLMELKRHFNTCPRTSLAELARVFQHDPEFIRQMLRHWLRKGVIRQVPPPSGCGRSCLKCDPLQLEMYELVR